MRTLCISIERDPKACPDDLWKVDVRIEGEEAQGYRLKGPAVPASENAIHLMRAVAPRIAEELVLGCATPGADINNSKTASILAESYMRKTRSVLTLDEDEKNQVKFGIIAEYERTVLMRLKYFQSEFNSIRESLMKTKFLNHRKCDAALQRIYAYLRNFSSG
jgi:hypothetical protein